MGFFSRLAQSLRRLFGSSITIGTPPTIDEIEAFEDRLNWILPHNWSLEKRDRRPFEIPSSRSSKPYLDDWNRYWVLSTPWPTHEPQRAQIHLYLIQNSVALPNNKELLTNWERFSIVAQDPSVVQINNDSFTWMTLPGWSDAKDDIKNSLR